MSELSAMFGGSVASKNNQINVWQLMQSTQGAVIPIVYGSNRVAPNWLWAGDYGSASGTSSKGAALFGKSGGTTRYFIGAALALAQGPGLGVFTGEPLGVGRAWQSGSANAVITTYGVAQQWIPFGGLDGQAPWGYLVTNHPEAAFGYSGVFYVATPSWMLGSSPQPPQISFEVYGLGMITGLNVFAFGAANGDCDVSLAFTDLWLNTELGLGMPGYVIGTSYQNGPAWTASFPFSSTSLSEWTTFIGAAGLWMSPLLDRQQPASKWFQDLLDCTGCEMIMTCEAIYVRPYCTVTVSGPTWNLLFQTYTYTPNLTPIATVTDDDYVVSDGQPPVTVNRTLKQDAYNEVKLEYVDRNNNYNASILTTKLQSEVDLFTYRPAQVARYHHVTRQDVAMKAAAMLLYKTTQDINRYTFTLKASWIWVDPMDIIAINDVDTGLVNYPVRVLEISEDENFNLAFICGDVWTCAPDSFATQVGISRSGQDAGAVPPSPINAPVIFEPPPALTNGTLQIYLAVSSSDASYGGCGVWVSYDGINGSYQRVGVCTGSNTQGFLTSALPSHATGEDTTNTLSVDVSKGSSTATLSSISNAAARLLNNLAYVGGELLSFETATLIGPQRYNLTTLERGAFATIAAAHGVGSTFAYLNAPGLASPGLFVFVSPPSATPLAQLIGTTLYFKFTPFNLEGQQEADISTVKAYPYTVTAAGLNPLIFSFNYSGKPTSSQVIADNVTTTGYELPAALASSIATAGTAATASTVFDIQVNGVTKGTITFAISGTTGTFVFSSNAPLALGDVVSILAPASPDSTLANITITLNAVTV